LAISAKVSPAALRGALEHHSAKIVGDLELEPEGVK
jgi:hypothetical protein